MRNKVLVTGGAGFIGINFVKYLIENTNKSVIVLDKMGYASNRGELDSIGVQYEIIDLVDRTSVESFFGRHSIDEIFHFAAESHVDNSIKDCSPFVMSNVVGTVNLLDMAIKHSITKFVHMSTDEVFGQVSYPNKFNEFSKISPRNPYSASKAAAEHFVISYGNCHNLPYIIINSSNNYGPFQHKEKLIPLVMSKIKAGETIPVYGKGNQIRDWIYVEDACEAIFTIYKKGMINGRYCIGGDMEISNLELIKKILKKMNASESLIRHVRDRSGHDTRYATDIYRVREELNWRPKTNLNDGLDKLIKEIICL
jgi:dTDP-glucose 4,6-dehydratase